MGKGMTSLLDLSCVRLTGQARGPGVGTVRIVLAVWRQDWHGMEDCDTSSKKGSETTEVGKVALKH